MANVFSVSGGVKNASPISGAIKQISNIGGSVSISSKSGKELRFLLRENFPQNGNIGILYIATDENKIYRWDDERYIPMSADVEEFINDEIVSQTSTWSSYKISDIIDQINASMNGKAEIYQQTTAQWNLNPSTISKKGAFYIYTDYKNQNGVNIPGIKIGDGNAYVVDLPFVTDWLSDGLVTDEERAFWNNKITAYAEGKNLVLTKN